MAENLPIKNVVTTTRILRKRFKHIGKATEKQLFEAFAETCTDPKLKLGGDPFKALPASFSPTYPPGHPRAGETVHFRVHAAWFRRQGSPDAFAAVIYDPKTTGYFFTHDLASDWPPWLDDFIKHVVAHMFFMEFEQKNPIQSTTVH